MIVAATRQVADWLVHPTTGVNAQLASAPRDPSDTTPPLVTVWEATRFEWVARGEIPRDKIGDGPLLLVRGPDAAELPIALTQGDGGLAPIDVLVAYVVRDRVEQYTDFALAHAYETIRAIARALQAVFNTTGTRQVRMGVELERPTLRFSAEQIPLTEAGGDLILAGVTITIPARDTWALGTP
jgi:hypothetical protein